MNSPGPHAGGHRRKVERQAAALGLSFGPDSEVQVLDQHPPNSYRPEPPQPESRSEQQSPNKNSRKFGQMDHRFNSTPATPDRYS